MADVAALVSALRRQDKLCGWRNITVREHACRIIFACQRPEATAPSGVVEAAVFGGAVQAVLAAVLALARILVADIVVGVVFAALDAPAHLRFLGVRVCVSGQPHPLYRQQVVSKVASVALNACDRVVSIAALGAAV